jgi:hypothetical protein
MQAFVHINTVPLVLLPTTDARVRFTPVPATTATRWAANPVRGNTGRDEPLFLKRAPGEYNQIEKWYDFCVSARSRTA